MTKRFINLASFLVVLFLGPSAWAQETPVKRSEAVERHLVEASAAWEHLTQEDLVGMEKVLEPGYLEIEKLVASYPRNESNQAKTNLFLHQRGWDHLIWTQMMIRLMAIDHGLYDQELEFAEKVALERVARSSLNLVERSFARMQTLLRAKRLFGLNPQVDDFAQDVFQGENTNDNYEVAVAHFQDDFLAHRDAILARLRSGHHPGIFDPAELPRGTVYAKMYEEHRDRLDGENRLDEILKSLARYDSGRVHQLAEVAEQGSTPHIREEAANELKVRLLLLEDSLDASETDPSVNHMIQYCDYIAPLVLDPFGGVYEDDFQELVSLVFRAKRNLETQSDPEVLKDLYAMGDALH